MTRDEWIEVKEAHKADNRQVRATKNCGGEFVLNLSVMVHLEYGVAEWLFNKAINGCADSLFKLEHSFDLYQEVINKAKEEGII